jgi:hypothetical protein
VLPLKGARATACIHFITPGFRYLCIVDHIGASYMVVVVVVAGAVTA